MTEDWRLFVAALVMYVSTIPAVSWSDPPAATLITVAAIDLAFAVLFFALSNVIYGTVMTCLLLSQTVASVLFYIDYNTGGGFFYNQYENINAAITLAQAASLIAIGGMRVRHIGIVEHFYDVRISNIAMLLPLVGGKKRLENH